MAPLHGILFEVKSVARISCQLSFLAMVSTHLAFSKEEKHIHELMIRLSGLVRNALKHATEALLDADRGLAKEVIDNDGQINRLYHQVTEHCIVAIALRQPVASDLRELVASMQIAAELERIGDYAADIADMVGQMENRLDGELRDRFEGLGQHCLSMLGRIMDIYKQPSVEASESLAAEDDIVDTIEEEIRLVGVEKMRACPDYIADGMRAICVAHKLERTADRVTNIAERIVYRTSGDVVELD